jgi:hypothetical protein
VKPGTETWARVVFVVGDGYHCDEAEGPSGREWSDKQAHAVKLGHDEAHRLAAAFRDAKADARVIRLRPRAVEETCPMSGTSISEPCSCGS